MRAKHPIILHRRPSGTDYDDFGNPVVGTPDPETILAISIGPRYSIESGGLAVVGLMVALPESFGITSDDEVEVNGSLYEVDGDLVDSNAGLGRWKPGFVMNLKKGGGM